MAPLNRMVWEVLSELRWEVVIREKRLNTVAQAKGTLWGFRGRKGLLFATKPELSSLAQLDFSPSEEKGVHERRLDIQAKVKLHRVSQVTARTSDNILWRWGFQHKKYEIQVRRLRSQLRLKSHTSCVITGKIPQYCASVSSSVKHLLISKGCCKDQILYYTQTYFIIWKVL